MALLWSRKLPKHPEVTEKLGGGWTDIQRTFQLFKDTDLAPKAERIYHDASSQQVHVLKSHNDEGVQQILDLSPKAAKELHEKGQEAEELKRLFSDDEKMKGPARQGSWTAGSHIDISSLSKIATSKSEDAKKLLEETYSDVLSVLKEKSEKAKKLAEDAKEEAEKGSSQSG
ncbi:hypothetical protein FRC04_002922 [Tulasnella sp. 424]|nr:hypothetical protein FRC04_002922 [Tulasnella sp. 424]